MNVSKGDMAELIASSDGKQLGAVCQVLEYDGHAEYDSSGLMMHFWHVRFSYPIMLTQYDREHNFHSRSLGTNASVPDSWLRRIKPLPCDEAINEAETVLA